MNSNFITSCHAFKSSILTEDLVEKILGGLDNEYKSIVNAIKGCENLISFDELHEKLINKELLLCANQSISLALLASTNPIHTHHNFEKNQLGPY